MVRKKGIDAVVARREEMSFLVIYCTADCKCGTFVGV